MSEVCLAGWAWRTALGQGNEALSRILAGETALVPPPEALAAYGVPRMAPLNDTPRPSPHARTLHRLSLLGLEAAVGLAEGWTGDRERLGVFTALGGLRALWEDLLVGLSDQVEDGSRPWARGLGKVHPYWMLRHLSNNVHSTLAIAVSARGDGATYAGANGGAAAVSGAIRALQAGALDAALVLGVDTLIQPEILLEGGLTGRFETVGPGEAAVALLLTAQGPGPRVRAFAGAGHRGQTLTIDIQNALGQLGAVTALAQIVVASALGPGLWTASDAGPPGLCSTVWVQNPAETP